MNTRRVICHLLFCAMLIPTAVYGEEHLASGTNPDAAIVVNDSIITARIKAQLQGEQMSDYANVIVETDGQGAVYLSGTVKSQDRVDKVIGIARNTDGVTSVTSNIVVKWAD